MCVPGATPGAAVESSVYKRDGAVLQPPTIAINAMDMLSVA
jgi:hypothetical protein